jgi:hypothetical protein
MQDYVMLSAEKSALLRAFLSGLPQPAAMRLARAVEIDRLGGGTVLPHDLILGALRPMLHHVERTPTPLRLFCRPFEDLVHVENPKEKIKGRIARESLVAMWNWLCRTLQPEAAAAYQSDTRALIIARRFDDARARAASFWPLAATVLAHGIASDPQAARTALESDAAVADAREMVLLMTVGTEIGEIQRLLPKPTPQLTDEMLAGLRDIHDRLAKSAADAAPYVAVVAMNRLVHPWEALKLPQLVTRQTDDTLISNTDMGLVGDLLFADIELHGGAVRNARHPVFDVHALLDNLADFTALSSSIVREIDIRRDGKWGKRLMKDRAAIAETMEGFMERAPKEIATMLPVLRGGAFGGGPKSADFSRAVDEDRADRGLRYARLLVGCAPYAAAASFAAAQKDAYDEASLHLRGYNEDLIREMRAPNESRRAVIARQFELAAELTKLLFSPEEADFLRRRAKAATAQAVAA